MKKYNCRNDVPDKYKVKMDDYYKDEKDFESHLIKLKDNIDKLKNYKNKLSDANKLYEFLNLYINTLNEWENSYVYSFIKDDLELGISENIERKNKTLVLMNEFELNTAFFVPEILKLEKEEYNKLYDVCPKLNEFKYYLDDIFRNKEHTLSEDEEKIITSLVNSMNNFDDISSTMLNSEHNYGKIKLSNGEVDTITTNNYRRLSKDKDERIRKKLYDKFNKKLDEYSITNAMLLNNYVKMNVTLAKLRHFDSAWDSSLFGIRLSNKVFESLISASEENIDVLSKYYKLKKKVLGMNKIHKYDMNLDLIHSSKKYEIEEAQKIILDALKPLGGDYLSKFKKIFDNNYIDYCGYKGKINGAYSASTLSRDSRIVMSFNEDIDSISTIIHEGGHNVNYQYIKENNPMQYREISVRVAEVASLTNECLLSHYFLEHGKTKEEKLNGLENILRVFAANFYGAIREGKMELDMYELVEKDGTITKDFMDSLSYNSLKKYYNNEVVLDKSIKNDWVNRSHYYMKFYLFSYAICISVATVVASKILSGDKTMLDNYLKFLSTGGDVIPKDAFLILGIDIESKDTYVDAIKYFDSLIEKFEKIYDEEV